MFKLVCFALLVCTASADFCADLEKILGSDCKAQKPNCLTVSCDINLLDVERVKVDLDLYGICLDTAEKNIKFKIVEADLDIHYSHEIDFDSSGFNGEFAIPGLSIKIPVTGITAGVYGVVNISGTEGDFTLDAGLDACATTDSVTCGSSLTHALPVWLIRGSANATDACLAPTPPPSPPTPPPTPSAATTAACQKCIDYTSVLGHVKAWCWETNKCYDVGDVVHDHCYDDDCATKSKTSSCEMHTCTRKGDNETDVSF